MKPPYSIEAEAALLGCCLQAPDALPGVLEMIGADDFYREANHRIFRAVTSLWERGAPCDPIAVSEELRATGTFEGVGGWDYLTELVDVAPVASNVEQYVTIVREHSLRRRAIDVASRALRALGDGEPLEDTVSSTLASLATIGGAKRSRYVWIKEDLWQVFEALEKEAEEGYKRGVQTGIPSLDRMTRGLQNGDLVILAGRPSMGKTAMAVQAAVRAGRDHVTTFFASVEMTRDQLVRRALSFLSGVNLRNLGSQDDYHKLATAAGHLNTIPVHISDDPGETIEHVSAGLRRAAAEQKPGLIIVDYLQLLDAEGENRTAQVGRISRGLKLMAKEFDVPVVALSQLSRSVEHRTPPRPQLSDLRDSGTIEQDADIVLLLWRPEYYFTDRTSDEARSRWMGKAELIVAKQRNGPTGSIAMAWEPNATRFTELEQHSALRP